MECTREVLETNFFSSCSVLEFSELILKLYFPLLTNLLKIIQTLVETIAFQETNDEIVDAIRAAVVVVAVAVVVAAAAAGGCGGGGWLVVVVGWR